MRPMDEDGPTNHRYAPGPRILTNTGFIPAANPISEIRVSVAEMPRGERVLDIRVWRLREDGSRFATQHGLFLSRLRGAAFLKAVKDGLELLESMSSSGQAVNGHVVAAALPEDEPGGRP